MELLIYHGFSYSKISNLLDISFDVVRDLKESRVLHISNKNRFITNAPLHDSVYDVFLNQYEEGSSFLFLYEQLGLGMQDVGVLAEMIFKKNLLLRHGKGLQKRISEMLSEECPVSMIAKQLCISVSIVKKQKRLLEL